MQVSIYKPSKTTMQSGNANSDYWLIEFQQDITREKEQLMGWISSKDTQRQVKLKFSTIEQAIEFAKANNWEFEIEEPNLKKFSKRSYADNFK